MAARKATITKKTTMSCTNTSSTAKASDRKSATPRKQAAKTGKASGKAASHRWSAEVTEHSDAMDLQDGVFKGRDPHKIALSIKHSAEESERRKGNPYQSAMSMLTFYINRAGHNLTPARRKTLDAAKDHLRELFGKAD